MERDVHDAMERDVHDAMERDVHDAMERVGKIELTVAAAPPTPDAEQRWQQRVEALTNWLLSEWEREQKREAA